MTRQKYHHLLHVGSRRLGPGSSAFFEAVGDFCAKLVVHLEDLLDVRRRNAVAQDLAAFWPEALRKSNVYLLAIKKRLIYLVLAHGVFFCDGTIVKFSQRGRYDHRLQHKQQHCSPLSKITWQVARDPKSTEGACGTEFKRQKKRSAIIGQRREAHR